MRFHVAMDSVEQENRLLRYVALGLLLTAFGFAASFMRASQKDPLIIERGCFLKTVAPLTAEVTKDDVKAFLEEAVRARFNTDQNAGSLLSPEQAAARQHEQDDLAKQKMRQVVLFNDVEFKGDDYFIATDRLISVGDVRSAFRFPLQVSIKQVQRTESNPYGLILTDVKAVEEKKPSQK